MDAVTFVIEVKVPDILFLYFKKLRFQVFCFFILFVLAEGGICGVCVFCCVTYTFCRRGVKRGVDA